MPDPFGPWDSGWADGNVADGHRAGQVPRFAAVPWFNKIWGGDPTVAEPGSRADYAELRLLVILTILIAELPGIAILITLGAALVLFAAIGRRPVMPGVARSLVWLYRFLVAGEAVLWVITWDAPQHTGPPLAEYAMGVLIVWLLVLAGRRVWAQARPA